jgi:hypothetical protein
MVRGPTAWCSAALHRYVGKASGLILAFKIALILLAAERRPAITAGRDSPPDEPSVHLDVRVGWQAW